MLICVAVVDVEVTGELDVEACRVYSGRVVVVASVAVVGKGVVVEEVGVSVCGVETTAVVLSSIVVVVA